MSAAVAKCRLVLNVPLLYWLQQAELLPLGAAGWALVGGYSLGSALWLWRLRGLFDRRLDGLGALKTAA